MGRRVRVPWRERYRVSKKILGQAFRLAWTERRFLVFPALGILGLLAAVGLYATAFALVPDAAAGLFLSISAPWDRLLVGLLGLPLMVPGIIVMSLFGSAYVFAIHERIQGRLVTRRHAWHRAWSQLGPITRFTLYGVIVAAFLQTLGAVLEHLRFIPWLGRLFETLGTFGWAVASYFVFPILVVEKERSATRALRRSVGLARDQWGKSVAGIVTIGLAMIIPMLIVMFVVMAFFFGAMMFVVTNGGPVSLTLLLIVWFVVLGIIMVPFFLFGQVTGLAYQTALYRYATTGDVARPFTDETLVDAWKPYQQG